MARTNASGTAALIFIAVLVIVTGKISEFDVWSYVAYFLVAAAFLLLIIKLGNRYSRQKYITSKYHDSEIANRILAGQFWQGQTSEQLIDSIGKPIDVDHKALKTKSKEVWKYKSLGKNRYGLRITVENGEVIGWDMKS